MSACTDIKPAVGEVQELRRNFSLFSVLGISFSLANSWFGISTALATGINAGGPVQLVYGTIIIGIVCLCIGASLAELASAMPDAGGQYYWTSQLASPRYARFASYLTGWIAWAGSLFTCASIALGVGNLCMGCIQMAHPGLEIKPWMSFLAYQVVNAACALFNTYSKILPSLTLFTLWSSIISFLVIILAISCKAPSHQSAHWVFTTFINRTGWDSNGIAFIVGLINPNWAFNGLDCATHMAEEARDPERIVPIAILGTVGIGFVTAWLFGIAMLFSIQDFDLISSTPTGVPILELFDQSLHNKAGAIVLLSLITVTGCGCLIASHTWQARLCWSFARDNGLPYSRFLATVHPKAHVPINAHIVSSIIVAVLGCLYLASYSAFNSMVTACIVLLYLSYSIPVLCLWLYGRSKLRRGPFWLGRLGWVCNSVLFGWFLFALVMYSFPPIYPVSADNMNYVSVVYFVVSAIVIAWWYASARKSYSVTHAGAHRD
ncbi:amino acid transporter [Aaosphaeria arxii CBS 175.79]|uniref:Amino acid transporter n=1 Tax=Aaosphaeria arxii CBS 175.79 TaxID=1450172 RepID=A0A6A5XDG3_9PLEO|nr:amino acid transporter [Aaosphaeria arxii CBS 175.79]KAF2010903.1 amino acid transporter [Aaosphaeria arxii CBS 175.79]